MTDLLVLHDVGAPGADEWRDAFADWPGRVLAPDLPGHNGTPPRVGGQYETGDAVYVALDLLGSAFHDRPPLVVGVGHSGTAAQTLALGGRASGLVLVDGLGGPWLDTDAIDRLLLETRRAMLHADGSMEQPAPGADDPRASLVVGTVDRSFAARMAEALRVPTLVLETPESPTPDAAELAAMAADAVVQRLPVRRAGPIATAVRAWWRVRS